MRKILLAIILSVPALNSFCQESNLLKYFKYRIDHYQALNLGLAANSQYNKAEQTSLTNEHSGAGANISAGFNSLKSTDRILFTSSATLFTNFSAVKSTSPTDLAKANYLYVQPKLSLLNKWFSKNMFTELGVTASGTVNHSKTDDSNISSNTKRNEANYTIELNAGIGKGRLENITDMQNALWLNEALTASKSLSRALSAEELNDLGRTITQGNNTRVLDSRKRTQFILETVDRYLQGKGLISKTDINYFSNLNDILFFAFNNQRLAGTEKFIRITPAISGWNNNQFENNLVNKYELRSNLKSVTLSTGFSRYIPASLVHQNNYGATVKLTYFTSDFKSRFLTNNVETSSSNGSSDLKQAGLYLFYQHGIYPNTRTDINFTLNAETGYQSIDATKGFYGNVNLGAGLNYFISYRTRFVGNLIAQYQSNYYSGGQFIQSHPNTVNLSVTAGLEISI